MVGGKVGTSDPENREYLKRVETLIADLGLADLVQWTGFTERSEVSASFAGSDTCVLPYRDGVSYRRGSFVAALAHGVRNIAHALLGDDDISDPLGIKTSREPNIDGLIERIRRIHSIGEAPDPR